MEHSTDEVSEVCKSERIQKMHRRICQIKASEKTLHLKNKQIVVAMQDQNHPNRSVKDRTFHFNYRIMYTGRYSDDKSEELHSIVVKGKRNENSAQSKRHLYKIKKMYTENVIGQYTTN